MDLLSETGSIADSNLRDVDLELAAVTAHALVVEDSVHQSSVQESPAIDTGHALTMDNVTTVPLCSQFITCAHAPPLVVTSNKLLLTSAGTTALLRGLVSRQSCKGQSACSQARLYSVAFSSAPGMPVAPPVPYRAPERRQRHTAPCTLLECRQRHTAPCRAQSAALQPMTGMQ